MKLQKLSQYKIDSDGNISLSGAMSPMLGAQEFVRQQYEGKLQLTQLYRVWFDDPEICTTWEDADIHPVSPDILAMELNFKYVAVVADFGTMIMPVMLDFRDKDPRMSNSYLQYEWIKKATEEELKEICDAVAIQFDASIAEFRRISKP